MRRLFVTLLLVVFMAIGMSVTAYAGPDNPAVKIPRRHIVKEPKSFGHYIDGKELAGEWYREPGDEEDEAVFYLYQPEKKGYGYIAGGNSEEVEGGDSPVEIDGCWYFFDPEAHVRLGWHTDVNGTWYYGRRDTEPMGQLAIGWNYLEYNGICSWYYFDERGRMYADAVTPDGYYVGVDGAWREGVTAPLDAGWQLEGADRYYVVNGERIHGWRWIGDFCYYFDEGGKMLTGWHKLPINNRGEVGEKWYYFNTGVYDEVPQGGLISGAVDGHILARDGSFTGQYTLRYGPIEIDPITGEAVVVQQQ